MKVLRNPAAATEILRRAQAHRERHNNRDESVLHVSDVIYCRQKSWYRQHSPKHKEELEPETISLFLMGQGHHAVLQSCIPETPEFIEFEGMKIIGTPDMDLPEFADQMSPAMREALAISRVSIPPGEIKTTRASSNKAPIDSPHYIEQLASYCVQRGVTWGRLYIWHINGAYGKAQGGMRPTLLAWDVQFTPEELDAWKREMHGRGWDVLNESPPGVNNTHYKWECGYCPFNRSKGGPCVGGGEPAQPFFLQDNPPEWMK